MLEHKCENCEVWFPIERHTRIFVDHPPGQTTRAILIGTGYNMVYKGDMNREYAMCPRCGAVEHQFSAEARDQDEAADGA